MTKATINRLATNIEGLDQILGGGLPEYSFNLIAGPPGSGKTTLAHQLMFALATPARPALYFTVLGEPPLKMLRYQQQFDFFDASKIGKSIHFINLGDDAASGDLEKVLGSIAAAVQAHGPSLVCVDSFRSVILASKDRNSSFPNLQQFIQQLGILMTSWQATSFLIGEYFSEHEPNPIFTVADGLIWMRQSIERNSVVRKMEISKLRGQATLPGLHTFRITSAGIRVFAPPQVEESDEVAVIGATRLSLGVPGLDEMMGGGLPSGYSLLVAGPSGSGKSILAAAFLTEGARRNETGVIAAFEQRANKSRGEDIARLIDSGRIGVVDTRAVTVSVDEVSQLLIAEIRRLKATRVVIDSLSGFELALAPTFRGDFREIHGAHDDSAGQDRCYRADDLRAGGQIHRSALQPLWNRLSGRCDHRAALHRSRQPFAADDGRGQSARQPAFERTAPVRNRRRRDQVGRDADRSGRAARWQTDPTRCAAEVRQGGTAVNERSNPQEQAAASSMADSSRPPQLLEEVAQALRIAADLRRDDDPAWAGHLVEANEQLILASLHADQLAATAVHDLDALTRAGQHDALTGTPNRALMLDRLEHAVAVAKRNESRVAVLFVDLDNFKQINDTLSHTAGDEVLRATARRLEAAVRGSDTVSRHGGDEFLVLLAEISEPSAAALIANKILSALSTPVRAGTELVFISASIGIAIYPDDGEDASTLIHSADTAMYRSKRNARGRYAFHSDVARKSGDDALPELFPRTIRRRDACRLEQQRRQQEEQERTLWNLREANANLVAAALKIEQDRERPAQPTSPQLELQAAVARELRSSFTPRQELVELLNQVHTGEPLLQVLIEREVARLSAQPYESFTGPRSSPANFMRHETIKAGQFDAVTPDGAHHTILEFTVTAHGSTVDQTQCSQTHRSFGLANGDRVDCLGPSLFRITTTGVRLQTY